MIRDCDYIQTKDNIIYIVHGDYHPENSIRCTPVYIPSEDGNRVSNLTGIKYIKKIDEYPTPNSIVAKLHPGYLPLDNEIKNTYLVPRKNIVKYFYPREKTKEILDKKLKHTKWESLISSIMIIGHVPVEKIGIYGSLLVGLDNGISDVDILIYGKENFDKLKSKFDEILSNSGVKKASLEQRTARVASWNKYSQISQDKLLKMELNRWSRVNVYDDIISCIRFVYDDDEIPIQKKYPPTIKEVKVKGKVIQALGTNFCPRIAKVEIEGKEVNVISYGFLFFSCVKDNEEVEIFGNLRKDGDNECIVLEEPYHYIAPK